MQLTADLQLIPMGVGVSLSKYIATCEKILVEFKLKTELHAYGTNIEGEWDTVMAAIKKCHEAIHAMGAPRIASTVKLGTRTDRSQSLEEAVRSVRTKM
jgi:uncharacterized protein (TIGR00106 family)